MVYIVLAVVVLVLYLLFWNRRPKDFPPGPVGIPILGNLFQIGSMVHEVALESRHKYGDIQSYQMGVNWAVILNNPDDIREAFAKPELAGRTGFNFVLDDHVESTNYGLIQSIGDKWHHLRRFTLKTLRDFGFAKRTSENAILEEANVLIEELREKVGQPLNTDKMFNISVFNVIWSILAGERHAHDDKRMSRFIQLLETLFSTFMDPLIIILFLFPKVVDLRNKLPFLFPKTPARALREEIFSFFKEVIEQHRQTIQKGQPRDYIDALIEEADENKEIKELDFMMSLFDFFLAGSETTSGTLRWSLFAVAWNPEIQEKIYQEIQNVAANRQVTLADRPNMPYMDKFFQELLRFASIAPVGAPHATTKDIYFKGFFIPKDTMVMGSNYAAHNLPEIWGDPKNFRPERFDDQEKVGTRHKAWMPFGIGKRSCLGESLAKDEFFLFFANIIQHFKVSFSEDEPRPKLEARPFTGAARAPAHHKIVFKTRI